MRLQEVVVLFCLCIVGFCEFSCGLKDDKIEDLPGLSHQPSFNQYSGYLKAQGSKTLHYWFVESQGHPESDPVVLWLNGGPGCSSLDGFLSEHGPFLVNSDGKTLHYNPYSWNKVANMLYLESPAGVGFSYSLDKNYTTDDDTVSMDNYVALQDFFLKFPQFRKNAFYVTGESYGGVYVPTLSLRILEGNATINMKGFAIGNGLSSFELNENSLVYFAYYHGLIGDVLWSQLQKYCCQDTIHCGFYNSSNPECNKLVSQVDFIVADIGLNIYGLYHNCSGLKSKDVRLFFAFRNIFKPRNALAKRVRVGKYKIDFGISPPCINATAITVYLNSVSVRQALHIPEKVQKWTICSGPINKHYKILYKNMSPFYKKLLQHYRAMVYNGDTDMACNFLGDQMFVDNLGLQTLRERRPWRNRHQVAGFVKDFEKLTFVTIKGAGHMVPEDRPPEALQMFTSFLADKPL